MGRRGLRLAGAVLVIYGLIGIVIFVVVASGVARPLERARQLSASVETQRAALVDSLSEAEMTIRNMSDGVARMGTSLGDAKAATDRAAVISHGVAASMYQLRDAMGLSIFGAQPLIGLSSSFDVSGQNLDLLAEDVAGIGAALDTNRGDVTLTAQNLADLATSVHGLTAAVQEGPGVEISAATLDSVRLAIYAVCGWLVLLAAGCVVAGGYMLWFSRRLSPGRATKDP